MQTPSPQVSTRAEGVEDMVVSILYASCYIRDNIRPAAFTIDLISPFNFAQCTRIPTEQLTHCVPNERKLKRKEEKI